MESSQRDLSIDMAVNRFTVKNNQITLSPNFTSIPKTIVKLPKTGVSLCFVRIIERSESMALA